MHCLDMWLAISQQNIGAEYRNTGNGQHAARTCAAYRAIHEIQPECRVGYAHQQRPMVAKRTWNPLDVLMRNLRYNSVNMAFPSAISTGVMKGPFAKIQIPEAKGTQDYLGLNYYTVETVSFNLGKRKELFSHHEFPADADMSDTNFLANIPEGLFESIKWAVHTYPNLPILITENGVEDFR